MLKIFTDIESLYSLAGGELKKISNAAIVTKKDRIVWVGPRVEALRKFRGAKKIALRMKTVLPAFIDCHTHTIFAGDRRDEFEKRNAGMTYQRIADEGGGIVRTVSSTRKASSAELLRLAEERCQAYLQQGVTTVEIKSGYGLTLKDEIKILKVAQSIKSVRTIPSFLGPHAVPAGMSAENYLDEVISWLPRISKLCRRADIFIEKGYFDKDLAEKYFSALQRFNFDVVAHCEQLSQSGGIDLALRANAVSVDHCVHATSEQIQKIAKSKTVAVLLPASDFYLRIDYPPARGLLDAGARVALATDFNPGTSPTQSVNFVGILARLKMRMSLEEVVRAFTLNAAMALGQEENLGSLEPGKIADFVGFNCELSDLFYQVGYHPVGCVFLGGSAAKIKKS